MPNPSQPRSVKIGEDERGGWTSDRPRQPGGRPRVEDVSVRNEVLRPVPTLIYSPGSLLLIVSPSAEERDAFAQRHVSGAPLLSRGKVRGLLEGRVDDDQIEEKTDQLVEAAVVKRLEAGDTVVVPLESTGPDERERYVRMAARFKRPRHLILLEPGGEEPSDDVSDLRRRLGAGELGADGFHTALRLAGKAIADVKEILFRSRQREE
jgi:hypothetical protein